MRIRNRIMQMIDVERHYYSHKNGISVLIGVSFFLLSFNIIFNAFYCFGVADDARSLLSFRQSIYLLVGYLILFFIYATMIRYIGFSYPIVLCYTAVSYIVNAVSGFLVTKASYSWTLNVLIDNPVGFEAYARRAYQEAYSNITTIIVAYLIISLIPAFRRRSYLLGRLWFFNLLTPLLVLPPMVLVILLVPEEEKLDYAYTSIVAYISLMAFYSVRYLLKTLYYLLLFPSRRRMKLVKLSSKRYGKLVNRKPGLFKRHIPLLSENVFDNQELSNVTEATVGSAEPTEATVGSAELTELTEGSVGNAEPTTATNGSAEQVQSEDIENEPSAEKDFSEPMPYSIAVMDINPNETESDVDNTIGPEDIPSVSLSNLEDVQKESDDINQSDIPIDIVEIESDEEINVATSDEDNAGTTETTDDTQQEKIDEEDDEPQLGDDIIESSITDEVIEDTSDEVSVVNETSEDDKSDSDNNSEQHEETDTKTDSKTESDDTDDIPEETNDDPTVELIEEVVDETNNISEASDNDSVVESEEDTINKTDDEEQEIINTELSE